MMLMKLEDDQKQIGGCTTHSSRLARPQLVAARPTRASRLVRVEQVCKFLLASVFCSWFGGYSKFVLLPQILIYTPQYIIIHCIDVRETHYNPQVREIDFDKQGATKIGFLSEFRGIQFSLVTSIVFHPPLLELISVCNQQLINTIILIH